MITTIFHIHRIISPFWILIYSNNYSVFTYSTSLSKDCYKRVTIFSSIYWVKIDENKRGKDLAYSENCKQKDKKAKIVASSAQPSIWLREKLAFRILENIKLTNPKIYCQSQKKIYLIQDLCGVLAI